MQKKIIGKYTITLEPYRTFGKITAKSKEEGTWEMTFQKWEWAYDWYRKIKTVAGVEHFMDMVQIRNEDYPNGMPWEQ